MVIVQKYNRNEKKHKFLLDSLLFCYECKHRIGVRGKQNGYMFMICNNYRRNSKLGLCTSHGFSYEQLENQVLQYIRNIFEKIDSEKIEINIKANRTKYDYDKLLKKIETEIRLINDNIDKMYVDKLNKKISEEMYERLFNKLINEVKKKEQEYTEIDNGRKENKIDDSEEIKRIIKEFLKLEKPTPEIMKIIINRIEVHQDKQVDIYFNFKNLQRLTENDSKNL